MVHCKVPEHQTWHGRSVARERFLKEYVEAAPLKATEVKPGTTMQTSLQFITAENAETGIFSDPWSVHVDLTIPWSGLDLTNASIAAFDALVRDELVKFSLQRKVSLAAAPPNCGHSNSVHNGIYTTARLEESTVIPVSALLFSRVGFMKQFLARPGAQHFVDRLVVPRRPP